MSVWVGIDVGKDRLDVASSAGRCWQVSNGASGLKQLVSDLVVQQPQLVVLEASGGYELNAAHALAAAGLQVSIVNPRQVRDFARGMGKLAKTDPIDARVLARFAEVVRPAPRPLAREGASQLQALVLRRGQLVELLSREKHHLATAGDACVRADIQAHMAELKLRRAALQRQISQLIHADQDWCRRQQVMTSIKGVGDVLAQTLLAGLPELGSLGGKQIALLVGTAPLNRDSGRMKGKRTVWGGRARVRAVLYMSTLVASRHNQQIRAFYQRLLARGKAKKLALVACMRKLIVILNAMVRDLATWRPTPLTT